jgi:hypothetical protein
MNQDVFCSGRKYGFDMAGLLKRVDVNLIEADDRYHGSQSENDNYNGNPAPHSRAHFLQALAALAIIFYWDAS